MPQDRLPNMLGIIVCAIMVLGTNANPMTSVFLGIFVGAIAHYALALRMRRGKD